MMRTNFLFLCKTTLSILAVVGLLHAADASTFTVNSTADDGNGTCTQAKCTLRDAILNAKFGDHITFSLPAHSTIALTNGTLSINNTVAIIGPGAGSLTIARSSAAGTVAFRILDVSSAGANADISGVTFANGNDNTSDGGGAIKNIGSLTLTACTISANNASNSGAIANTGTLTINNSTLSGNSGFQVGAIYNTGSPGVLTITNSTVSGNTSDNDGSITNFEGGAVTISNCTISGNIGARGGVGIWSESANPVTITNSTVSNNTAARPGGGGVGGGIFCGSGTIKLRSTIVAKNTADTAPDIYVVNPGTVSSQGYNLIGNNSGANITATTGDQIGTAAVPIDPLLGPLQDNGGPTQTQALLSGSKAIDKGDSGGLVADQRGFTRPVDTPSITNPGDGTDVGAYEVQPNQLVGCSEINLVVNNASDSDGGSLRSVIGSACGGSTITFADGVRGAINLTSGELSLNKNLIINGPGANLLTVQRTTGAASNFRVFHMTGNTSDAISGLTIANGNVPGSLGGGISNDNGNLTLTNVVVTGNTADLGAGLYNGRTATVVGSTLYGNTVSGNNPGDGGGGIYSGGALTVTNSTISGNVAHATGGGDRGGGILNNLGTVTLMGCTIANNSADSGGGVMNTNNGTVNSRSTIIALNTSPNGPDVNGALHSQEYNLIGNNAQATITPNYADDLVGTPAAMIDPLLGPLQNNGGPTLTHALQTGSPALDKGSSNGLTTDQRGLPRPSDDPTIANPAFGDGSDIGAFELQVSTPTPTPTPVPGLVANVSTRLLVGAGDNALIEGFIVQGPAGSTKKIIVRAIGPSLLPFGVGDALANPTLEIHDSTTATVATNNDWKNTIVGGLIAGDQSAEINNSGVAPTDDLESAIIANLTPGNYTAVVRGVNDTTGTAVVDAFDLSPASPAKLANVATRGLIQPGDKLMIGGFIVQNGSVRVVVRAIGPSLAAFGITNALPDTTLQLRDQNGAIVRENDDWMTDQKAELEATGLQPTNNLEAALLQTIPPGNYTAQVRGKPETTGTGVVEIYFLP